MPDLDAAWPPSYSGQIMDHLHKVEHYSEAQAGRLFAQVRVGTVAGGLGTCGMWGLGLPHVVNELGSEMGAQAES